jgi:probable HAF family extracellular repeat protein
MEEVMSLKLKLRLSPRETGNMSTLRRLRNLCILSVTTVVLAGFSDAVAQASYKVTDLGTLGNDNMSCAMALNNQGLTAIQDGNAPPGQQDRIGALVNGRDAIVINGVQIDLGTLGGQNSFMNWGEINDRAQIVGYSETDVPDPNGEDICGFGTHLTCRPFLWQNFQMSALPTLGGNNGQASAINNHGQIAGFAENGTVDSSCPPGTTNNRVQLPVLWENRKAQALPTGSDPDGDAIWINDQGQAVGFTATCNTATIHAVSWENGAVSQLPDLGTGALAFGNNNQGQIVGAIGSADGTTQYGALWQNGVLTNLGLLPGDFAGTASGINSKGQVVGSNFDSNFNWSHAFIYQNGVMTDLNTLIPASSNLNLTMANKINERGQISAMAIVLSGPDAGNIHAILLTPVNESIGRSVADVVRTYPKTNLPANVGKQLLPRFVLGRFGR